MESGAPTRTQFPDIYREFESLQAQVRQAAQDYIISPQASAVPLEVRNIEVRSFMLFNSVIDLRGQKHNALGYMEGEPGCQVWIGLCCVSGCQVSGDSG